MVFAAVGTYKKFFETRMVELNQSPIPPVAVGTISSLEDQFRNVHCLGTKEAGGRLLTRIVQRQKRTFICSLGRNPGMPPSKIDRIGPKGCMRDSVRGRFSRTMNRAFSAGLRAFLLPRALP